MNMKLKMKKLLSFLLSFLMLFSNMSFTLAEEGATPPETTQETTEETSAAEETSEPQQIVVQATSTAVNNVPDSKGVLNPVVKIVDRDGKVIQKPALGDEKYRLYIRLYDESYNTYFHYLTADPIDLSDGSESLELFSHDFVAVNSADSNRVISEECSLVFMMLTTAASLDSVVNGVNLKNYGVGAEGQEITGIKFDSFLSGSYELSSRRPSTSNATLEFTEIVLNSGDIEINSFDASKAYSGLLNTNAPAGAKRSQKKNTETKGENENTTGAQVETLSGLIGLNISASEEVLEGKESFIVPVTLDTPVDLLQGKNAQIVGKPTLNLYHDPKNDGNTVPMESVTWDVREDGKLYGFEFKTDSLSPFVVTYTVDFTYVDEQGEEHLISFAGRDTYAIADILTNLDITFDTIDSASLELTEVIGDAKDVDSQGRDALYLDDNVLHSYAPFNDVYTLLACWLEKNIILRWMIKL